MTSYTAERKPGTTFYTPRCFNYFNNGKQVKQDSVPVLARDQAIKQVFLAEAAAYNSNR